MAVTSISRKYARVCAPSYARSITKAQSVTTVSRKYARVCELVREYENMGAWP